MNTVECDMCHATPGILAPASEWFEVEDYYQYVQRPANICSPECLVRLALFAVDRSARVDEREAFSEPPKKRRWWSK